MGQLRKFECGLSLGENVPVLNFLSVKIVWWLFLILRPRTLIVEVFERRYYDVYN